MADDLSWDRDGRDWPNRDHSRFVDAAGLRWHVQCMGHGPVLLLLHGTGSATHSWRDLMPLLAADFHVVAPDLPGHGFSAAAPAAARSLPGVAHAVGSLLQALNLRADCIGGHSAGAAISAQMAAAGVACPRSLVWMDGALLPFKGLAGRWAAPLAQFLSRGAFPRLASWRAREDRNVRRLIDSTGSQIDERGVAAYRLLLESPAHVAGALALMGGWDLPLLAPALPRLAMPVLLLHGGNDRTVPAAQADQVARRLPQARVRLLPGLGHLAHEERPALVASLLRQFALETTAPP